MTPVAYPETFLKKMFTKGKNKRGQLTIFIIIAIVLVAGIGGFFLIRDKIMITRIPANIEPAYKTFLTCLEENAEVGIDVLESQGGYIELPDFEPGSVHMPFSSQRNFVGNPIPYWYYVSGNGIEKEQVPSKTEMKEQLQSFIEGKIRDCNFKRYYDEGFEIELGEPKALVNILNNNVEVKLNMKMNIQKGEDNVLIKSHKMSVKSRLGTLYNSAKKVYGKEQKDLFLENYAVDFLRLYAPVDGVDITCSPKTWDANKIFDSLGKAIEANTFSLKTKGDFFDKKDKYFIVDVNVDEDVRFITSKDWPSAFEVLPSEGNMLLANPIGNQPGLGILGFCYVPYHFVYNVKYPVLVQVSSGKETFQFPLAVVVQGNKPREALDASAGQAKVELCKYKNTPILVKTYDSSLNPIDAEISYKCLGEKCNIGTTSKGELNSEFPQCVNGYVIARADGFKDSKQILSTTQAGSADVVLDRLYNMNINLKLDSVSYGDKAIIYFISDDGAKTVVYPEQKNVKLVEGQYEIQVYIFKDSSIQLPETIHEECIEIPKSGVGGWFGMKEKNCFDVKIPSQIVSNVLAGGGKQEYYILESDLQGSDTIEIHAESLAIPKTLEELQNNYLMFDDKNLVVFFR